MVVGVAEPIDAHSSHLEIHIKDAGEYHSFPAIASETGTNGHETQLPAEAQLFQMLSSLQRQLDEQRTEAARERENVTLERRDRPRPKSARHSN